MTNNKLEMIKNIMKFGRETCKSVWNSKPAQIFMREYTGKALVEKLKNNRDKIFLYGAITASTVHTANLNSKLADNLDGLKVVENRSDRGKKESGKTADFAQEQAKSEKENKADGDVKPKDKLKDVKEKKTEKASKKGESRELCAVQKHNLDIFNKTQASMVAFVVYFEKFSDVPYLDSGGVPTIGYGTTIYPNGKRVTMRDLPISRTLPADLISEHVIEGKDKDNKQPMYAKAREYAEYHIQHRVIPVMLKNVKVKLTEGQAVGMSSLVYNIGEGYFLSSSFLKQLNKGNKKAFSYMTKFNSVGKKWNSGLQVRRGIEYLVADGKLNHHELINFRVSGGYDKENHTTLFSGKIVKREGGVINIPRTDAEAVNKFLLRQKGNGLKVKTVMDRKIVNKISNDYQLALRDKKSRGA